MKKLKEYNVMQLVGQAFGQSENCIITQSQLTCILGKDHDIPTGALHS